MYELHTYQLKDRVSVLSCFKMVDMCTILPPTGRVFPPFTLNLEAGFCDLLKQ